jgi:hypothetical protein
LESGSLREALHSGAGVLVEEAFDGPLAMVQAVFDRGRMVAFHANRRVAEGSGGGASHKESIDLPDVRTDLTRLGNHLDWHGGLSADVILSPARGPQIIDINPRLVEPGNAMRSGVDLVGTLLEVAIGGNPATEPGGTAGRRTHQLLLAILGAAQQDGSRRAVWRTTLEAMLHRGLYRGSSEELTPLAGDYRAVVPLAVALTLTSILPGRGEGLASSSTGTYAVSAQGWQQLVGTFSNRP